MNQINREFASLLTDWQGVAVLDHPSPESHRLAGELLQGAESLLEQEAGGSVEPVLWHRYLDLTRESLFLQSLSDDSRRLRWAESTFRAVDFSGYTLETMLEQRLARHPRRILFRGRGDEPGQSWSYEWVARQIRRIAAVFLAARPAPDAPRVAIVSENSLEGACCDLACLVYDVFVTPLSSFFNAEILVTIFELLGINIVVTDVAGLGAQLDTVQEGMSQEIEVFVLGGGDCLFRDDGMTLAERCATIGEDQIKHLLASRPRRPLHAVATTMFTSGSTGVPKGVDFTIYNLVTKRFARAAALPAVGRDETLLCYLPLYHTFGRYLEMMGMLFWGGTYVFLGNPSAETLIASLTEERPTGLIGIPRRWEQIHDRCLDSMSLVGDAAHQHRTVCELLGGRLRWGLSAAGYLDPKVFRFFQRHGVALCSGFGMTEATGGITMTPPGAYEENSVGIPLPGVRTRLSEVGELQISGPYIARYREQCEHSGDADEAHGADKDAAQGMGLPDSDWLATGDIFAIRPSGHLEIVDRIKDIYKNSKGQTIAPRQIEQKFVDVPGFKRTFVVGDHRDDNVLLIVPDRDDLVLSAAPTEEAVQEYFLRIIAAANADLAPYERVVGFELLNRDFELERGELTPKGSFHRRVVEQNFEDVIARLYERDFVQIELQRLQVRIPRWFYRDLGILETQIVAADGGLLNTASQSVLAIVRDSDPAKVRIGDLVYLHEGDLIDLGLFARQPKLWMGNPELMTFFPCKEGWDLPLTGTSPQVFLQRTTTAGWKIPRERQCRWKTVIRDETLAEVNGLCVTALFAPLDEVLPAVRELAVILSRAGLRIGNVIRRRLEALAWHPELEARCQAYQVLLLDEPVPNYSRLLPSFVDSGQPFLNEACIESITKSDLGKRRLAALRKRLHGYRAQLDWPASKDVRERFVEIFRLLTNFVRVHPGYYSSVRAEFVCWILHDTDTELAESASEHLFALESSFESSLDASTLESREEDWEGKLVFQDSIPGIEVRHLEKILKGTTFLRESVMLVFPQASFEIGRVPAGGIWISKILSSRRQRLYRLSINTSIGEHYDLLLIVRRDMDHAWVKNTNLWMIVLHGYPHGMAVTPRFGCCRPALGALSLAYVNGVTLWNKIQEIADRGGSREEAVEPDLWRRHYVRSMAAFFMGWRASGRRIVPGAVDPRNVVLPQRDFRRCGTILSLDAWRPYEGPLSLVDAMILNFYRQVAHHYPWCRSKIKMEWIFDACLDALGNEEGRGFLEELARTTRETEYTQETGGEEEDLRAALQRYLEALSRDYHEPMPLRRAIQRFSEWQVFNPRATARAREQFVFELNRLYRLDRYESLARYHLYRRTYFSQAERGVQLAFDTLLQAMFRQPRKHPTHFVELADLQALLTESEDRSVLSRLVYPHAPVETPLELVAIGRRERHVVVRTHISNARKETFTVREPVEPAEIGRLYRLFREEGMPLDVSARDRHFVAIDNQDRIIGGICFRFEEDPVVHLEGVVVYTPLQRWGIRGAMVEDFCQRMSDQKVAVIKTHFSSRTLFLSHGFHVDHRWGGLVRFLKARGQDGFTFVEEADAAEE